MKLRSCVIIPGLFLMILLTGAGILSVPTTGNQQPNGGADMQKITAYEVRASVLILGDMGAVGSMKIEESSRRQGDMLEKILYLYGNTHPKQVEKGRDIGGEFRITKRLPLGQDGAIDEAAVNMGQTVGSFYKGRLKRNEKVTGEEVVFFPDHVIATREDGTEVQIHGKFGSPLAALEYLIENDIKTGDVFESKFILNGIPYIFKCKVEKPEFFESLGVSAFKVTVSTYYGHKRNKYGNAVAIKKKGIRIWFCKEGAYKNTIVQMNIKYKWYLTLKIFVMP